MPDVTPASPTTSFEPPFVGRERELMVLGAALRRASDGQGGIVLVSGDAGIGKTRLIEAFTGSLAGSDALMLWGHCSEWEGTPAYWPWMQIGRTYAERVDIEVLRADMGDGAQYLTRVLGGIRDLVLDLPAAPELDPEQARFQLFEASSAFFRNSARRQPLVLVLDDLHWADEPSLLLLQYLAREIQSEPILILGTYRNVDVGRRSPLAKTLTALARERNSSRLVLRRLTESDVARYVAFHASHVPDTDLVAAIYRETEGQPFYLTEVVRLLAARGPLQRMGGRGQLEIRIPESVREVIGQRLDQLSEGCNQILAVASVVGRDFSLNVLEMATERPASELLNLLDQSLRAQIIQETGRIGTYRFSHSLIQQTLYEELSVARRAHLHQQIAAGLRHVFDEDDILEELAHHYVLAVPLGTYEAAVDFSIRAGDRAMDQVAWEAAAKHYERALEVLQLQPAMSNRRRCEVHLALGSAYWLAGQASVAQQHSLMAAELARALGEAEFLARAALNYTGIEVHSINAPDEHNISLLEEALETLPEEDSALRVDLLRSMAVYLLGHPDPAVREDIQRRERFSQEAVEMARRLKNERLLLRAMLSRWRAVVIPDTHAQRLGISSEMVELAEQLGDPLLASQSYRFHSRDLLEAGDKQGSDLWFRRACDIAQDLDLASADLHEHHYEIERALISGQFDVAQEHIEPALEIGRQAWPKNQASWYIDIMLIPLYRELETMASIVSSPSQAVNEDDLDYQNTWRSIHILQLIEAGQQDAARSEFEELAAHKFEDFRRHLAWLADMALASEFAVYFNDVKLCDAAYRLLLPYADRPVYVNGQSLFMGSVSQYLGSLATSLKRWNEAEGHFEQALEMNARMGARPFTGWTEFAYADMLTKRGRAEDRERVAALLDRALTAAGDMGMVRLQKRAAPLASQLLSGEGSDPEELHGLTPRQVEVLQLVAEGLSDREIGERLFISHHTVMRHVANIFNALGVNSRTAAVAYALRHGML